MSKLQFARVRNVKAPTRGTSKSAGIDFYVPKFNEKLIKDIAEKNPSIHQIRPECFDYIIVNNMIILGPHQRILIPSGVHIKGNEEKAYNFHNKSGIATNKGLDRLAEVVDEDYQGEIHISIVNTSPYMVCIREDEKLVQLLTMKIDYEELEEVTINNLYQEKTERGAGGFGSTGSK